MIRDWKNLKEEASKDIYCFTWGIITIMMRTQKMKYLEFLRDWLSHCYQSDERNSDSKWKWGLSCRKLEVKPFLAHLCKEHSACTSPCPGRLNFKMMKVLNIKALRLLLSYLYPEKKRRERIQGETFNKRVAEHLNLKNSQPL